jgi:hypothetical protein
MNNKINFSYINYSFLSSILGEKLLLNNKSLYYNYIKFYFLLKNEGSNRFLFLLKIMLIEKLTNNKIKFVYNANLLKKKKMKVGGYLVVSKQKIYSLLLMIFYYSLPKLVYSLDINLNNYYTFYNTKWNIYSVLFLSLTKFLFFNFFSHNLDYYKYYNFFENAIYKLKIKVSTSFKYYLINRDLFRLIGFNII